MAEPVTSSMKRVTLRHYILLILPALFCPFTGLFAAGIYKWVDEHGQTHYSERPLNDNATEVEIKRSPEADSETIKRVKQDEKLLRIYEEERIQKEQDDMRVQKEQEQQKQQCIRARTKLERLAYSGPLYRLDKSGERVYLSDEDRASEKAFWQKQVNKLCDGN